MKKLLFGLSALVVCLMMASCGNDPVSKVKSVAERISNEGDDWTDAQQWEDAADEVMDAFLEFAESDFEEEDLNEGVEAVLELADAVTSVKDKKALKAMAKAFKKIEKKSDKLEKKFESATKKMEKRAKKLKIDEDELIDKSDQRKLEKKMEKFITRISEYMV